MVRPFLAPTPPQLSSPHLTSHLPPPRLPPVPPLQPGRAQAHPRPGPLRHRQAGVHQGHGHAHVSGYPQPQVRYELALEAQVPGPCTPAARSSSRMRLLLYTDMLACRCTSCPGTQSYSIATHQVLNPILPAPLRVLELFPAVTTALYPRLHRAILARFSNGFGPHPLVPVPVPVPPKVRVLRVRRQGGCAQRGPAGYCFLNSHQIVKSIVIFILNSGFLSLSLPQVCVLRVRRLPARGGCAQRGRPRGGPHRLPRLQEEVEHGAAAQQGQLRGQADDQDAGGVGWVGWVHGAGWWCRRQGLHGSTSSARAGELREWQG